MDAGQGQDATEGEHGLAAEIAATVGRGVAEAAQGIADALAGVGETPADHPLEHPMVSTAMPE